MAYLSSEARAASNGEYGRGGCGYARTHWHNMPDAVVTVSQNSDSLGPIEIRWKVDGTNGIKAYLTTDEARTLRDKLTAAISESESNDNDVDDTDTVNADGSGSLPEWVRQAIQNGYPSARDAAGITEPEEVL